MDTIQEIDKLLDQLKEAREKSAEARKARQSIIEAAQKTIDYQVADEATNAADDLITQLEANIKQQALSLHELCAELPERVAVKMFTVIDPYDEQKAKEWSLSHFTPAIKLDTKVFEKAVKDGNIPVELATTHKEARAQIATKL